MTALWRFGWGVARSMGTGDYICVTLRGGAPWGFTLREGEGDTYRPFLVSQVSICLSVCLCVKLTNIKVLIWNRGFLLPVSHCKYVKNRRMKVLFIILWGSYNISKIGPRAPHVWYQFLLISFWVIPCKPLTETLTGGEFIRSGARRCIFVCVGHVLVRDSSGPLYGQGQERERERECEGWGQCGLLSLTETLAREQKALHRRATHLESERYVQEYQTNIKMAQTQIWPHRYHLKWTFKYMTERREGKL